MNYIGSKHSLLPFLEEGISDVAGINPGAVFIDLFAGTGAVGTHFKRLGYRVLSNDIQKYSYVLNRHYIGNNRTPSFSELVKEFPELRGMTSEDRVIKICEHLS